MIIHLEEFKLFLYLKNKVNVLVILYFRVFFHYFSSVNYPGKICDQQEILQQWLLTLPTTLLEDVVEKVNC